MLVDIILVLIILAFVVLGWIRGFMLSVFALASTLVAIILASMLSPVVSSWIEKTGAADAMGNKFASYVETGLTENLDKAANVNIEEAVAELPLPQFFTESISDKITEQTVEMSEESIKNISEKIGQEAATVVCGIIGFIIVFVIVYVLLQVVKNVLKIASKLPIIKQADKLGGIAIGLVEGVLFVLLILLIVSMFSSVQGMKGVIEAVEESTLARFAYENNIIGKIISIFL